MTEQPNPVMYSRRGTTDNHSVSNMSSLNTLQALQIERYRLTFLINCKSLKRPPPSLRLRGCFALEDIEKIKVISEAESKALLKSIVAKKRKIKCLELELKKSKVKMTPLSKYQKKKWKSRFKKKIAFYESKENAEWKNWPKKTVLMEKEKDRIKTTKKTVRNLKRKYNIIQKEAQSLLNNGSVRVLVDIPVPPETIVVLGKGLGFVPTPSQDSIELNLDARRLMNNIVRDANQRSKEHNPESSNSAELEENLVSPTFSLPSKLRQTSYLKTRLVNADVETSSIVKQIGNKLNSLEPYIGIKKKIQRNLSFYERQGLEWLNKKVFNREICVTEADKGGAILLVPINTLEKSIKDKLENTALYEMLKYDPRNEIYNNLIELWKQAKQENFVSDIEAKEIVGLTLKNNKSTASKFKPGRTYFVPSLKIHKLPVDAIKPGCEIPARLITCLQESVTSRSDIFITSKWLKELERDYCSDLVKDTTDTLVWLDDIEKLTMASKNNFTPFTFDFESLYDSLEPNLVLKALNDAMKKCRISWSNDFCNWICKLVQLSVDSAIGEFKGNFYKQKRGIATGGSNCVELANITVFYVLKNVLYSKPDKMKGIIDIKRFIDDGCGIHKMSASKFKSFSSYVSENVKKYGLKIKESDWNVPTNARESVSFLDIKLKFDEKKSIQTSLYRKPTDSRSYLNFNSCHPNHIFTGVVYSQALRLRRIIKDDEELLNELNTLKDDFKRCNYPSKMLEKFIEKAKTMSRDDLLKKEKNKKEKNVNRHEKNDSIMVVSTHGRDKELIKTTKTLEKNYPGLKFKYVKKTGPSLKKMLTKSKEIALGPSKGFTKKCDRARCKSCNLMSQKNYLKIKGNKGKLYTAKGNCQTKNLIYNAQCKLCQKMYVGKSTQPFSERINGHRGAFYDCIKKEGKVKIRKKNDEDELILGMHLYANHNLTFKEAFNESYVFTILDVTSPKNIDVQEHKWIHKLKCIAPYGLNSQDPFGIDIKH